MKDAMSDSSHDWPTVLAQLLRGTDLSPAAATWAMREIMAGTASESQMAALLVALRAKGESAAEVGAFAEVMMANAVPITPPLPPGAVAVDVVGTGGDGANTVNISTMAAVVAAAAGAPVVKHGNRAASSASGSTDMLEALGVVADLEPSGVERCVAVAGIGYCFAPRFHPMTRAIAPVRRSIGIPTVFNFLGPIANPARPQAMAVGCADERMAQVLAGALAARGISALLFRGHDGLDEFTTTAPTQVWVIGEGEVRETTLDAADLGVARVNIAQLRGADPEFNATIARRVLGGEQGPISEAVAVNTAAALVAHAGVAPRHSDAAIMAALRDQLARARETLVTGAAAATLERWIAASTAAADTSAADIDVARTGGAGS